MEFDDECRPIENLAIDELNSFKFSQNATYCDCATACVLLLLRKMELSPAVSDGRLLSPAKFQTRQVLDGHVGKIVSRHKRRVCGHDRSNEKCINSTTNGTEPKKGGWFVVKKTQQQMA